MISKLLLAVLFTLFITCNLYAQHSTINGQIKDTAGNSLAGSAILLYRFTDSILIKTSITDSRGNYEISQVKADRYFITASFMGYKKISSPVFTFNPERLVEYCAGWCPLSRSGRQRRGVTETSSKNGKCLINLPLFFNRFKCLHAYCT